MNTEKVLAHIAKHPAGLKFSEIQRFVVEGNGLDYDEKVEEHGWGNTKKMVRRYRGYWCTNLIANRGPYNNRIGILHKFCDKVGDRYVVKAS